MTSSSSVSSPLFRRKRSCWMLWDVLLLKVKQLGRKILAARFRKILIIPENYTRHDGIIANHRPLPSLPRLSASSRHRRSNWMVSTVSEQDLLLPAQQARQLTNGTTNFIRWPSVAERLYAPSPPTPVTHSLTHSLSVRTVLPWWLNHFLDVHRVRCCYVYIANGSKFGFLKTICHWSAINLLIIPSWFSSIWIPSRGSKWRGESTKNARRESTRRQYFR